MTKEIMYDIKGMTCAACVSAVERASLKIEGVQEANVNLTTAQLRVVVSPSFNEDKLYKAIRLSGFKIDTIDENETLSEKQQKILKQMRLQYLLALIFVIPLMYISMGHMIKLPLPSFLTPNEGPFGFALSQLLLTIPVMVIGYRYYLNGFKNIIRLHPNMDSLVAIGTIASFLYGVFGFVMIILGEVEYANYLYFEGSAVILTLVMVGKFLEQKSTTKTTSELEKLMDLKPKTAIKFDGNSYDEILLEEVKIKDQLMVRPGDVIPTDGKIINGSTAINESMMTGEPLPKDKVVGDTVIGGTVNVTGAILIEVTHVGEDTVLSNIIKKVSEAQMKKAPIQRLADIISGYFVPAVFLLAIGGFIFWMIYEGNFNKSINIFVSVLVVACPCALGLATPTAIMTGSGAAAKHGLLIASGEALELSSKTTLVAFDKTGTITEGKPQVIDILTTSNISKDKLLQIASSIEQQSSHPISVALLNEAKNRNLKMLELAEFENFTGFGLKGKVENKTYYIGNMKLMNEHEISLGQTTKAVEKFNKEGKTTIYISSEEELLGFITIADPLKPDVKKIIEILHKDNIQTILLSGDDENTVSYIAQEVGIKNYYGSLLPTDKQTLIKELKKDHRVMMIGDGINDAIALKEAHIGVGLASGTDIAMGAGDVVLMHQDLKGILTLIDLSKHTIRNIKQNLFWAFIYNTIGIFIALGVLSKFDIYLNPMISALAMSLSSFAVVTNALRLKFYKGVKIMLKVEGMNCNHCKAQVTEILKELGLKRIKIDLKTGNVKFKENKNVTEEIIIKSIEEAGYKVI